MEFFVVCIQVCIFHGSEVNHLSLFGPIFMLHVLWDFMLWPFSFQLSFSSLRKHVNFFTHIVKILMHDVSSSDQILPSKVFTIAGIIYRHEANVSSSAKNSFSF